MTKKDLKIVFMGTPDFAVESLRCLVEEGYNVVGVITMPDKPSGRHQTELSQSPIKKYALEAGIKVLQPERLKAPSFVEELRNMQADLQIVVAFRMLPEIVWNMPQLGTFNLHASLLPKYRGAAPINWAIINGETETGITTFFLKHEIDTGEVIQQVAVEIKDTDNAEIVHNKLMVLGGKLVVETVDNIVAGTISPIAQESMIEQEPGNAPKIFKETCRIDWNKGVKATYDFVRGLSPYPTAWTELTIDNEIKILKIYETEKAFEDHNHSIGTTLCDGKTLRVALQDGYLILKRIQLSGKKQMAISDFLRGFKWKESYFLK